MKKTSSSIAVAIICCLLGFVLANQFKLLNKNNNNAVIENKNTLSQIDKLKKEKESLLVSNNKLISEIKNIEEAISEEGFMESKIKKDLDIARMQLGILDVQGPGITIDIVPKTTMFSSNSSESLKEISENELVYLVNILWYARAEAISINDIRITPQTGIKTSGEYISIGAVRRIDPREKISIKIIGDSEMIKSALNFGGTLSYGNLENYLIEVANQNKIIIKKTTQMPRTDFIKPIE